MLLEYVYLNAVKSIVEANPTGLNTKQIAERLPEYRQKIIDFLKVQSSPVPTHANLENLPDAGKSRKTVRKYLNMLMFRDVKKVGIMYYPDKPVSSDALVQAIDKLVGSPDHQDWQLGPNLAIYRTYIDPRKYRNRIDDFFDSHIPRFADSLFFLDQILQDAIGSNQMSSRVFAPGKKMIDFGLLRTGWESYFGSTKLFILAYAVSPPELLRFIETKEGSQLASRMLAERWPDIKRGAEKKQKLLEAHALTLEYRKRKYKEEKT